MSLRFGTVEYGIINTTLDHTKICSELFQDAQFAEYQHLKFGVYNDTMWVYKYQLKQRVKNYFNVIYKQDRYGPVSRLL